jgi:hypothetical protein
VPTTKTIPIEALDGLGLRQGDTLHVLAVVNASLLVSITHKEPAAITGSASEWLKSSLGAVKVAEGESANDIRMDYYAGKYGLRR